MGLVKDRDRFVKYLTILESVSGQASLGFEYSMEIEE